MTLSDFYISSTWKIMNNTHLYLQMEINGHNSTRSLTLVSGMIWLTDEQLKAGVDAKVKDDIP